MISTITLAELSVGPLGLIRTEQERSARQAHLQQAEADFEPIPFDAPAARAGRSPPLCVGRWQSRGTFVRRMIASVAVANDLPFYTCNRADVTAIDQLRVIDVAHPDADFGIPALSLP